MKRTLRGGFTIEMAYLFPLILFVFGVLLHVLFYYHDKNIMLGTAHETAAYGAGMEKLQDDELENYFITRLQGKLLLFSKLEEEVEIEEEKVTVLCNAKKGAMTMRVVCSVNRTEPENYIRSVRKIIKIGKEKGNQE